MGLAQWNQLRHEILQPGIGLLPVQPGQFVILTVRIVIAVLRLTEFITGDQHRRSLRKYQRRQQGPFQLLATQDDFPQDGFPLLPAIPAEIVIRSIPIVLAVGLIMLVVVTDKVFHGESVMRSHIIDTGRRQPFACAEKILRSHEMLCEFSQRRPLMQPERAHTIAKLVIPFKPSERKTAQLIPLRSQIPGLGNQFDAGQYRIPGNRPEETGVNGIFPFFPGQCRRQIETETIDMHFRHPVPE